MLANWLHWLWHPMKMVMGFTLAIAIAASGTAYARWYGGIGIGGAVLTTPPSGCSVGVASFNSACNSSLFIVLGL